MGLRKFVVGSLAATGSAHVVLENDKLPLPVVIWHGMGDSCCNPISMGGIKKMMEEEIGEGAYVLSLEIGDNILADMKNSFFLDVNTQVDMVCKQLAEDEKLSKGFHAVGFSQGGQFLRAYVQRCNNPPVRNLVTVGSQHMGVNGVPRCASHNVLCDQMASLVGMGAYKDFVQSHVVQAQYWHDPANEEEYLKKSLFLADINNEREVKNETYKKNLMSLENFVMIKFNRDTMVIPRESEWFGWYKDGSTNETVPLNETRLYKEDWLGLQAMDRQGKLAFYGVDGNHLHLDPNWFADNIVDKYLGGRP